MTDAESLHRGALGCGTIMHMAALVKMWVPEGEAFDRINVGGLRNVLAAARDAPGVAPPKRHIPYAAVAWLREKGIVPA